MFAQEKLSHIVAVALLLVAVQGITFVEYFGLVDRKENSFDSAVGHIVPNCALTECPNPQAMNQTVLNAERDLLAFNMGDSVILYWADLPSRAKSLVFYRSESKNGPWLKVFSCPITDSTPQQVVDSVAGDRAHWYRAEALAGDGAILKSYSILEVPTYVGDGSEDNEFTWKTYRNEEYGFEMKYPKDEIKISENTAFYPTGPNIVFPSNGFQIVIDTKYVGDFSNFRYLGLEAERITEDGFRVYSTANASVPFIAFAKANNGSIYVVEFAGDTKLSVEERQILSTFKFLE